MALYIVFYRGNRSDLINRHLATTGSDLIKRNIYKEWTMTTSNTTAPVQPIFVRVTYQRRNGDTEYDVLKAFKIEHGDIEQGLKEIDEKMFDLFNYWDGEKYADRDMGDYSEIKEPLKSFWISHEEIMYYDGHKVIPENEYEVLIKHLWWKPHIFNNILTNKLLYVVFIWTALEAKYFVWYNCSTLYMY